MKIFKLILKSNWIKNGSLWNAKGAEDRKSGRKKGKKSRGGKWEIEGGCWKPLSVRREREKEGGSDVPPAAVCRLCVHGGWAEWKAQPARREHLARHQLCTGHARRPASTAQTHKHWRSKQRQTNTRQTPWQHVRGESGGRWRTGTASNSLLCLLLMRGQVLLCHIYKQRWNNHWTLWPNQGYRGVNN